MFKNKKEFKTWCLSQKMPVVSVRSCGKKWPKGSYQALLADFWKGGHVIVYRPKDDRVCVCRVDSDGVERFVLEVIIPKIPQ